MYLKCIEMFNFCGSLGYADLVKHEAPKFGQNAPPPSIHF